MHPSPAKTREREGGGEGGKERERERVRQTDRQTNGQTGRQTDRRAGGQTDRHTNRKRFPVGFGSRDRNYFGAIILGEGARPA